MRGANLQSLRQHNRSSVLAALQRAGTPLALTELKDVTGLSRPTIESVLQTLITEGVAREAGLRETPSSQQGGRPARLFAFEPRAGSLVAVVFGLDDVQVAVADLAGTMLGWQITPVTPGVTRAELARDRLEVLLTSLDVTWDAVRSVTIGIVGVHTTSGAILRNRGIPELATPGYFDALTREFTCPVRFVNDAYLAALAQYNELCDPAETHSMIGLHVTSAIGCGILVGGELFQGYSGAAAEMGFDDTLGWVRADRMLRDLTASEGILPATVFQRAGDNEPRYRTFAEDFMTTALPGIRALTLALDPQVLTIGGVITQAREVIDPIIREGLAVLPSEGPDLRYSALGEEAVVTGALADGVRHIEGNL